MARMVARHPAPLSRASLLARIATAGLLSAVILGVTSYLINVVWLGAAHEALDVFRPDDHPLRMPGLPLSSLAWGLLFASGYRVFWRRAAAGPGWLAGARYGASVCLFFTLIQSVFLYQFVRISADLLLGDVVHYLLASTLAGAVIGAVVPRRLA